LIINFCALGFAAVAAYGLRRRRGRSGGNAKKTARIPDLHRPTLYRKLKHFKPINI
jgi:transcriptional regulator of acetoin/glycerol metabolism